MLYNYNAGPSALSHQVKDRVVDAIGSVEGGPGILELSHRSAAFDTIINEARQTIRRLYQLPESHEVLFLQGGASLQFAMIALNLGTRGGFLTTGEWSRRAFTEANKLSRDPQDCPIEIYSNEPVFKAVPHQLSLNRLHQCTQPLDYIHLTSNNTIYGTQYKALPYWFNDQGNIIQSREIPGYVIDASSDIFSRTVDWSRIDILYAGAQKNAGPSGVTIVIGRRELLRSPPRSKHCPKILSYQTHAEKNSLYHTPNTLGIFTVGEVARWVESQGGIKVMEQRANERAQRVYELIDHYSMYQGHAEVPARSKMNITFTVTQPNLESRLLSLAEEWNMWGLKGHRSVGGLRASLYNAVSDEAVERLCQLLEYVAREDR